MKEDNNIENVDNLKPDEPAAEPQQPSEDNTGEDSPKPERTSELKEAIRKQAIEGEAAQSASFTLRRILGGEFLTAHMLRKQTGVILLVSLFTLIYVSNRYSCQKDLLEINELNDKIKDAKYKALATSSELTEMCRESNVLEMLQNNKDSVLHIATQPPYIIKVPEQ